MMDTPELLWSVAALVASYLLGSLSMAVIVCRALGLPDPRESGSGNPGATNVLRSGRKLAAALTLLGDMGKGLVAVLLVRWLHDTPTALAGAAAGAFLGHLYPLFFGFRGGKGVATALGVVLGLSWVTGLLAMLTWLATTLTFRLSSLAALVTFTLTPIYFWWMNGDVLLTVCLGGISVLLFWRHRGNVRRLIEGTESRVGR